MDAELTTIPRHLLEKYFGRDPRMVAAFENQAIAVITAVETSVAATDNLADATVVTLSPNAALNNEFVIHDGDGTKLALTSNAVAINVDETVARAMDNKVTFVAPADVTLFLPIEGELLSTTMPQKAYNKTLDKPAMSSLVNAASDAAAAAAGVTVGGIYHNAGALRIRLA